uniref:Uncharacterized protein n=1 Tax=Vespula pensylvanica TaxID=30213 RepID=A0A834NKB6_VESPE|nr:hypothetical protein H0235_013265 [Vespula pensylvanica]
MSGRAVLAALMALVALAKYGDLFGREGSERLALGGWRKTTERREDESTREQDSSGKFCELMVRSPLVPVDDVTRGQLPESGRKRSPEMIVLALNVTGITKEVSPERRTLDHS